MTGGEWNTVYGGRRANGQGKLAFSLATASEQRQQRGSGQQREWTGALWTCWTCGNLSWHPIMRVCRHASCPRAKAAAGPPAAAKPGRAAAAGKPPWAARAPPAVKTLGEVAVIRKAPASIAGLLEAAREPRQGSQATVEPQQPLPQGVAGPAAGAGVPARELVAWRRKERESLEQSIKICEEEGDHEMAQRLRKNMEDGKAKAVKPQQEASTSRRYNDAEKRVWMLERQDAEVKERADKLREELESLDKMRAELAGEIRVTKKVMAELAMDIAAANGAGGDDADEGGARAMEGVVGTRVGLSRAREILMTPGGTRVAVNEEEHQAYQKYFAWLEREGSEEEKLDRLDEQEFVWKRAVDRLCAEDAPRRGAAEVQQEPAPRRARQRGRGRSRTRSR